MFMKAERNMTAGNNQTEGKCYIIATFGVGLVGFHTVKYTPGHDGGQVHKRVRLGDLTT